MLRIVFDVIKSQDEEYLDRLEPSVEILESPDLALQAFLLFFKRYKVPSAIQFSAQPLRKGQRGCKPDGELKVSLGLHLDKPRKLHIADMFQLDDCPRCPTCAIYFDTRKDPVMYHKFIELFNQVGKDIVSVYDCVITNARIKHPERGKTNKTSLMFSLYNHGLLTDNNNYKCSATNQESIKVPSRRIRVE